MPLSFYISPIFCNEAVLFLFYLLYLQEYLTCLNEFRTSLPARLPHIEPVSPQDSAVRNTVQTISAQYRDLLNRANALSDRLSGVGGRQREYRDALDKARAWMREAEPRANKVREIYNYHL